MLEKYHIPDRTMLLDVQYIKPNKKENIPDTLYLIWKDIDTGKKYLTTIDDPTVNIYFEKPEFRNHSLCHTYQYLTNLDVKEVEYKNIIQSIVEDSGEAGKRKLSEIYKSREFSRMKEMYMYPYVYGADYGIEALYRYYWLTEKDNDLDKNITKGFADIEVDFLHKKGFPDPSTCPIDLVTLVDKSGKTCYTFSLVFQNYNSKREDIERIKNDISEEKYNKLIAKDEYFCKLYEGKHKQQREFIDHQEDIKKELHEMFDDKYGSLDYKFFFYEDERKMLVHLFQLINSLKLDFIEFWNFSFDIPFIYKRAEYLHIDPKSLFCHPDFKNQQCWFKEDKVHFDIKSKTDYFYCSSYTIYLCQMRTYAAIRKGRSELRSYNLNYIGKKEIKDSKYDYSEDGNLRSLSYRNFKKYFIYNIKDVLLQSGVEDVTNDLDNVYTTAYRTITPYDSIFKQTVKLRNVQYKSFQSQGLVPGPNTNIFASSKSKQSDDDEDDDSFEGALVGDPRLNLKTGMKLYGKKTNNLFEYAIDMDMSAFYPSTIRALNIDPSTLIFKCIVPADQFDINGGDKPVHTISNIPLLPDKESDFKDDVAKECFDNFQTKNYLSMGKKWFNLPSMKDMYEQLKEEL